MNFREVDPFCCIPNFNGLHKFNYATAPFVSTVMDTPLVVERLNSILSLASIIPLSNVTICRRLVQVGDELVQIGVWNEDINRRVKFNEIALLYNNLSSLVKNNNPDDILNLLDERIGINIFRGGLYG